MSHYKLPIDYCHRNPKKPFHKKFLTDNFLQLYIEKNSDGTKNLRLPGNELRQRISRVLDSEDIPVIVKFLKSVPIVKLDLAYNTIGDKGLKYLVYNYLQFPNELIELNLMHNDITENGLQALSWLGKTLTLKSLRLNGNKFGAEGGKLLGLILAKDVSIEHLDISETDQTLSSIAFITAMLREDRGYNKTITVLDISRIIPSFERYQYQSSHLAETVGEMLRFNTILVELHLQKCQLTGHDMESMLLGMKFNKTLKFLDLGYNCIADYGIELLGNFLKDYRPSMIGLNVAGNHISDTGARALSFTLPYSKIRLLDISYNRISSTGMADILYTIKKPYMLRFLSMWGNKFDEKTNQIIKRMMESGVLDQKYCDVIITQVDDHLEAGRYPSDLYKHKYYCQLNYAKLPPIKIVKNKTEDDGFKVDFKYYPKLPVKMMVDKK